MDLYQTIVRPFLFSGVKADPEQLHRQLIGALHRLSCWERGSMQDQQIEAIATLLHGIAPRLRRQMQHTFCYTQPNLAQTLWHLPFPNPVGLAAGFDKDGLAAHIWSALGFGFAELGTVTLHAQPGNPPPRLFRLPQDNAALNRMGFNNAGAAAMAEWLSWGGGERGVRGLGVGIGQREDEGREDEGRISSHLEPHISPTTSPNPEPQTPIGINLGKSKITPLESAAEDYRDSFRLLKEWGDYFVVNVSSPNTPGLRSLQDPEQLDRILSILQQENTVHKPLLVKIAPDLEWGAIADILTLAQTHHLSGIIATNTTIRRDGLRTQTLSTGNLVSEEAGGISGAPVRQRSTEVIRFIHRETAGTLPVIGVGGIFTAADAWEKITAGASLVQVYTGWIYEGPWMVRRILQGLSQRLEAGGFASIAEAVGSAVDG